MGEGRSPTGDVGRHRRSSERQVTTRFERGLHQRRRVVRPKRIAFVDNRFCVGCGICIEVCPESAIAMGDTYAVVDHRRCLGCGLCINECPDRAISLAVS